MTWVMAMEIATSPAGIAALVVGIVIGFASEILRWKKK